LTRRLELKMRYNNHIRKLLFLDAPINLPQHLLHQHISHFLFRLYHNTTPIITCSNAQWILWEFKTFWIMWLSVLFLVSRLINKYRMEYQFGLIQLWIYRMFFIEFFFSFDFIFNSLWLIYLATGFGYEKLFFLLYFLELFLDLVR